MFVQQVEIYKAPIKLKEPFKISLGSYAYATNIVVVLKTSTGLVGYGECSPFMSIHGESIETAYIVAQYLAKACIGKSVLPIQANVDSMDAVIYGNSCIKSAFNIALYDLAAQQANQPLYKFLGGTNTNKIQTDYTISIDGVGKMVNDAKTIIQNGFKIIKVKLGGNKEEDVERIKQIRAAVGNEIPIRIDANQGWTVETAIDILHQLEPYNIQHCEEPISRSLFAELPKIRQACSIPIMADESCCDHFDAQRLIDIQAVDSFNIKLSKSAGIDKALKIIEKAEMQGMKIQLGGFLESRLGFTAAAHVALVSDSIVYFDFDTPMMFQEDPIIGGILYKSEGFIEVPQTIGLGASYNPDYLSGLEKVSIE